MVRDRVSDRFEDDLQTSTSEFGHVRYFSPMIFVPLFSSLSPSLTFLLTLNREIFFPMAVSFVDGKCSISIVGRKERDDHLVFSSDKYQWLYGMFVTLSNGNSNDSSIRLDRFDSWCCATESDWKGSFVIRRLTHSSHSFRLSSCCVNK
jgi:hypothetical protein